MKSNKFTNAIIGAPTFVWLVVFYALPVLIVFLAISVFVGVFGGLNAIRNYLKV